MGDFWNSPLAPTVAVYTVLGLLWIGYWWWIRRWWRRWQQEQDARDRELALWHQLLELEGLAAAILPKPTVARIRYRHGVEAPHHRFAVPLHPQRLCGSCGCAACGS